MRTVYVEICFGHKSFTTGKTAIVKIQTDDDIKNITIFAKVAIKIICEELKLSEEEIAIFDWRFLGEDVLFI